jgi:hypothetical protein
MTAPKRTVSIHGKEYMPVAERLKDALAENDQMSVETTVLSHNPVVITATVTTKRGKFVGTSSVSLDSNKLIEKENPYEVAETSAVGRALGFAGYGVTDSIASADEMTYATRTSGYTPKKEVIQEEEIPVRDIAEDSGAIQAVTEKKKPMLITNDQKVEMMTLLGKKGKTMTDLQKAVDSFKVKSYQDLTYNNAKKLIDKMKTLEDIKLTDIVNPDDIPEQLGLAK